MEVSGNVEAVLSRKGRDVWSIRPGASVYEAIELMAQKNVGALLVMEGDELAGIMSERDYTRKVALKGKSSRTTPVSEILTAQAAMVVVQPGSTVAECMRLMTEHRTRHLPVVQEGKVVGLVSIGDLVNWIITTQSQTIEQLHNYISGTYPG
jgi:CBS domain-containing protein